LKYLKNSADAELKIILLGRRNNYVGSSSIINNTAKSFDILTNLT